MGGKIAFTSDLHGNEVQYRKLVEFAKREHIDTIIIGGDIGGDISPKGLSLKNYVSFQGEFIKKLEDIFSRLQNTAVFIMMGNDDCAANLDLLLAGKNYHTLHGNRFKLENGYEIVGYPYVPITPFFLLKDWEKFDFTIAPKAYYDEYSIKRCTSYNLLGLKSSPDGISEFLIPEHNEDSDSIQIDLESELITSNSTKTVYVFHSPPYNTWLDMIESGDHVGSMAIREFIEKQNPYITLHGHIHETVDISGRFWEKIGSTVCISSGNMKKGKNLAVVVFDIGYPSSAKRQII